MNRFEFGERHILKLVWRGNGVERTTCTSHNKAFQLKPVGYHRFIANPYKCQSLLVTDIIIWCLLSFIDMKQHKFLTIHFLKFEVDGRYRVKFGLYLLTYSLCVTLSISKSYHLVVVTNTKHKCSTLAIGKGRNTF